MDQIEVRMTVRLPADAAQFLESEAKADFTSKNAQVVRAVRAAMRAKGTEASEVRQ